MTSETPIRLPQPEENAREEAPAKGKRKRITNTRTLRLGDLTKAEREALYVEAYALYAAYKTGVDRATFERHFFADDDARVALFHDEAGALIGFYSAAVQRVAHEGRQHAVFGALLCIDTRYDGTREATVRAIVDALRFKLREPRTPLAFMGVVTTPASFRRLAVTMPTTYPSRHVPTPAAIDALVRETARLRGLTFVDEARWLVRGLGEPRQPERLKHSQSLRDDPHARFYMDRNPRFEEGIGMLIWFPLDVENLFRALVRRLLGDPLQRAKRT
jgi:hypothetical protein